MTVRLQACRKHGNRRGYAPGDGEAKGDDSFAETLFRLLDCRRKGAECCLT